jgi:hypothetical protein
MGCLLAARYIVKINTYSLFIQLFILKRITQMSEDGFHIHGAHEHELTHRASSGHSLSQRVAIFTAILATLYFKNNAVLKKAEASDQWSFYQAKSQKESLAKIAVSLTSDPNQRAFYNKEAERYAKEKEDIKVKAEALDKESLASNEESEKALHPHEKLAVSMTFLQIAIALASVTALTNKRWLLYGAALAALVGCGLGVVAYF